MKKRLDNKGFGGAILTDLSKSFDALNDKLSIAKLHAYGSDESSLKLLHSYLSNRWYRTKVNKKFIFWAELLKVIPQGSVLAPQFCNIYLTDFVFVALLHEY